MHPASVNQVQMASHRWRLNRPTAQHSAVPSRPVSSRQGGVEVGRGSRGGGRGGGGAVLQRTVWQQTTARAKEVQRRLFLPRTGVVMLLLLLLWTCRHVNSNRSNPKYGRYYCPTLLLPCVCFTIQRFSLSCLPSHYILSRSSSCSAKWTSSPSSRTVRYHL